MDVPGKVDKHISPYQDTYSLDNKVKTASCSKDDSQPTTGYDAEADSETDADFEGAQVVNILPSTAAVNSDPETSYIRLPSYEKVRNDSVLYAHVSRIFHRETNPGNARALVQAHGKRDLWLNPPPIPLSTEEMDWVFDFNYQRVPHPAYGDARIPAYEMIRFSVKNDRHPRYGVFPRQAARRLA